LKRTKAISSKRIQPSYNKEGLLLDFLSYYISIKKAAFIFVD